MRRVVASVVVAAFVIFWTFHAVHAAGPEDAKAMVEKAYTYLRENGKTEAFSEISNPYGQFVKGDLYVLVEDFNGLILADGGNPGFVGVNLIALRDTNGKYLFKEMIEMAKTKDSGWVEYTWLNPATKKIQPKSTYVKRIKGMDALIACGVLK